MRFPLRYLALAASAVAFGGALVATSGSALTTASPRAVHSNHVDSARFLAEARGALVHYLQSSHPTALLLHPARSAASTTAEKSYNWSGYADVSSTKGTFSQVAGSWTTPAVTCTAEDTITSEWVGLDGWTSSTVEQDGTISWCFESKATYFTWYEMYPAGTVEVGTALKPGDKITASVVRTGTSYKLSLTDSTNTANSFTETKTCAAATCVDTSAEWIAERSSFSIGIAPLADYKTWKLSAATETASGKSGTISSFSGNDSITMIDATASYDLSTVSALTTGNTFTTTWKNSY